MTTDNAAVTLARAAYRAAVEQAQAAHTAALAQTAHWGRTQNHHGQDPA